MSAHEQLQLAIREEEQRLRASVPADCDAALKALITWQDQQRPGPRTSMEPDLITGRQLPDAGWNRALQLCLEAPEHDLADGNVTTTWAETFLHACGELTAAEQVLEHVETGFMRIAGDDAGKLDAWIATKRPPTRWLERADVDWWSGWLHGRHNDELQRPDITSRERAVIHLKTMPHRLGYPSGTILGGTPVELWHAILIELMTLALDDRDRGVGPLVRAEHDLAEEIAAVLDADPWQVGEAIDAFTLDRANAGWHAAVPGVAAAPVIRPGSDRLLLSRHGLLTDPLLFLARELRRRDAESYHNIAYLRETVFREDLHALFRDKRFVTSSARIQLRRDGGNLRTDIDAAVFDRKTGTLGLFELKSQDPFARSVAELTRQRDNVLYANRQVSGVVTWVARHGGDEILNRVDSPTAKKFRVHKVFPFVLGRYLARFGDGPEPDTRAAWATWPQVLRLTGDHPNGSRDANPIASLFTRIGKDTPAAVSFDGLPPRTIAMGETVITIHPSYGAWQLGTIA